MTGQINVNKIAARTGSTITVESGHLITQPGSIIQVQHANFTSQISTTSSTIAATGIQMNFTPHIATSKLLVRFNIQGVYNASASSGWNFYVYRDGSAVTEDGLHSSGMFVYAVGYSTGEDIDEVSNEVRTALRTRLAGRATLRWRRATIGALPPLRTSREHPARSYGATAVPPRGPSG